MSSAFSFTATPTDPDSPLGLCVMLNNAVIFDTEHLSETQTISAEFNDEVEDVEHTIRIVLKNKTSEHTKVDELGAIVKDSMVSISDINLDDIELGQLFFEKSQYTHSFNTDSEPSVDQFYGNMGCNGTVEFKFSTPAYIWILENM
jgi:hypothetical protein